MTRGIDIPHKKKKHELSEQSRLCISNVVSLILSTASVSHSGPHGITEVGGSLSQDLYKFFLGAAPTPCTNLKTYALSS